MFFQVDIETLQVVHLQIGYRRPVDQSDAFYECRQHYYCKTYIYSRTHSPL